MSQQEATAIELKPTLVMTLGQRHLVYQLIDNDKVSGTDSIRLRLRVLNALEGFDFTETMERFSPRAGEDSSIKIDRDVARKLGEIIKERLDRGDGLPMWMAATLLDVYDNVNTLLAEKKE